MSQDRAVARVLRFVSERTGRAPDSIRLDETLASLDIDSLEYVEFCMELEDEVQGEVPDPIESIDTVADLVAFVRRFVEGK